MGTPDSVAFPLGTSRVIGVEVSFHPARYFRAVDWRVVAELLGLAYPHLRDQLRQRLGG